MVKIQNLNLQNLLEVYSKLLQADFPTTKESLNHIKKTKLIEEAFKVVESAKESLIKKYKLDGENKEDKVANDKANEAYVKILMEEIELDLTQFEEETLNSIKMKPIEFLLLEQLDLVKVEK